MRLVISIIVFLPTLLFAQKQSSYYLYDKKPIQTNSANFKRYIIPQLRAMSQEYYHLLRKLHSIHNDLVSIKDHLVSMRGSLKIFQQECQEKKQDCLVPLRGLYLQARKLDKLLLSIETEKINFSKVQTESEMSALLSLVNSLNEMSAQNYLFMHGVEEYLITAQTSFFPYFGGKQKLEPLLYRMAVTSEMIQTLLLSPPIRKEFNFAWTHFFRNIEEKIVKDKNKLYLTGRLEELNMAWNTFHMKMTKGNHQLPKNLIKIIKIMHNRWNSVLKILLRN